MTPLTLLMIAISLGALLYAARQTRANERATLTAVYQGLSALGNSINDLFVQRPELFRKIFGLPTEVSEKSVEDDHLEDPQRFYLALKWLDYFETALVVWPAIPSSLHRAWLDYIRSHFVISPYMRKIVLQTTWYSDRLRALCREAEEEAKKKPNQALQPAPMLVTPSADARVAPSTGVADL